MSDSEKVEATASTFESEMDKALDKVEDLETPTSFSTKEKVIAAVVIIAVILAVVLFGWFLYSLGDEDESALERLRDISIIFALFFFVLANIVFALVVALLAYLAILLKNEAIPAIVNLTATLEQVKGTTQFVTESAVKPVIDARSKVAGWRAAIKTVVKGK